MQEREIHNASVYAGFRLSKRTTLVICTGLAVFLGATDYLTGSELSFSIFYLVPISLAVILAGRNAGLIISGISGVLWLIADLSAGSHYSHFLIPLWNTVVRLGYFTIHSLLLTYLLESIKREKDKSLFDPLTNAANWRYFESYFQKQLEQSRRENKPLTVAYMDLDNFKAVNDTLGHAAGDHTICTIADITHENLRPTDMLARVGGDEFVVLLTDTDFDAAHGALERIRNAVTSEMVRMNSPVTMSIGAVTYTSLPSSVDIMINRADQLMYTVKHSGKNNIKHETWPNPQQPADGEPRRP